MRYKTAILQVVKVTVSCSIFRDPSKLRQDLTTCPELTGELLTDQSFNSVKIRDKVDETIIGLMLC